MDNNLSKAKCVVNGLRKETPDIVTIFFSPLDGEIGFKSGQYIAVYLDEEESSRPKFYTISSSPHEEFVSISVKKIGSFSGALHSLKEGDFIYVSGPYGNLYPDESNDKKAIFLAAGIGIAPFVSIVKDYQNRGINKEVDLYYSCKTKGDIAFCDELNEMASRSKNIKIFYCLTRDKEEHPFISLYGRMDGKYIQENSGDVSQKDFYLCGSDSFIEEIQKQLLENGALEENIFTESFF